MADTLSEFADSLIELIPQVMKGVMRYGRSDFIASNITPPQILVLEHLLHGGASQMSQLAGFLGVSRPAATGLIDRLIAQGFVKRKDDPDDRRVVWIEATAKGLETSRAILRHKRRAIMNVFDKISSEDRMHYLRILKEVARIASLPAKKKESISSK